METDSTYTVDGVTYTEMGDVVEAPTGPYCGNCNRGWRREYDIPKVRHADSASVKACYAAQAERDADAAAEAALDLATERYWEDRGVEESQAHDAWEASRGVVHPSYAVAL